MAKRRTKRRRTSQAVTWVGGVKVTATLKAPASWKSHENSSGRAAELFMATDADGDFLVGSGGCSDEYTICPKSGIPGLIEFLQGIIAPPK